MDNEEICEIQDAEMACRQHWLFGAFVVNLVMIAVVWILTFVPWLMNLGSIVTGLSVKMTHVAVIGALGLWGVFALAFFLAPALAIVRTRRASPIETI